MSDFISDLRTLGACSEAVTWAQDFPTLQAVWDACDRADWMLWLAQRVDGEIRPATRLAMCACARTALRYVPDGEDRPRLVIEAAERCALGEATVEEMAAAWAAAWDASWVAAGDAARVAAGAAAGDAAWVAGAAAGVAAGDAAWDAAGAAAWVAALREMATLVREHIPVAPEIGGGR